MLNSGARGVRVPHAAIPASPQDPPSQDHGGDGIRTSTSPDRASRPGTSNADGLQR